jgi:UDP-glucuronate 4-epimerase
MNNNFVTWCVLGDCSHPECHNCFPVKNCSKNHPECLNGTCPEIFRNMELKVLVTGCAGFIGSYVTEHLLKRGNQVLGIDNLNDYYDPKVKDKNLDVLRKYPNFEFRKEDICDTKSISEWKPHKICHLASMAGVRYSIQNPHIYDKVNIGGFIHILEESVKNNIKQVVYASSSSVYGLNTKVPFSEDDPIKTCNSPYACSKMAMELYAKTYNQ